MAVFYRENSLFHGKHTPEVTPSPSSSATPVTAFEPYTRPFGDQRFTVYETHYMGEPQPESWWLPRRVAGEVVFGVGGSSERSQCWTCNILGPDGQPLLGELEFAQELLSAEGRMAITGFQRPAHIKDLAWRVRSYPQQWLCIPRS